VPALVTATGRRTSKGSWRLRHWRAFFPRIGAVSVSLQQLQFFRAVARNLSFSQAATELYTSQPYVSNQIRRLENHFGVPLFFRTYPQIALTEAGQALFERVAQILSDVDGLDQVVQQFQGLQRGTVQLAATEAAGNHVMPELIASFHRKYPEIVVQMRVGNTEDALGWLDLDEVEIGISPQKPETKSLISEPFYRDPLVVIYPTDMDLPDPLPVAELAELPKVVREHGSLTLAKMSALLEDYPSGQAFVAQLSGTTAVNEAIAAGLGVSLVPARSAKPWIDAGLVLKSALEGEPRYHEFYVIYSQQRYVTPAARAFITHIRGLTPIEGDAELKTEDLPADDTRSRHSLE
jgi:DNA-binding transcriptional LysR family regulator